jgi:hypothetical protein
VLALTQNQKLFLAVGPDQPTEAARPDYPSNHGAASDGNFSRPITSKHVAIFVQPGPFRNNVRVLQFRLELLASNRKPLPIHQPFFNLIFLAVDDLGSQRDLLLRGQHQARAQSEGWHEEEESRVHVRWSHSEANVRVRRRVEKGSEKGTRIELSGGRLQKIYQPWPFFPASRILAMNSAFAQTPVKVFGNKITRLQNTLI